MAEQEDQQEKGPMLCFAAQVAPGVEAFSRYQMSWLPNDIAAGVSVATVALPIEIRDTGV